MFEFIKKFFARGSDKKESKHTREWDGHGTGSSGGGAQASKSKEEATQQQLARRKLKARNKK